VQRQEKGNKAQSNIDIYENDKIREAGLIRTRKVRKPGSRHKWKCGEIQNGIKQASIFARLGKVHDTANKGRVFCALTKIEERKSDPNNTETGDKIKTCEKDPTNGRAEKDSKRTTPALRNRKGRGELRS